MIKQGIVKEGLSVDSYARKGNGSCPLMPEEVLFFHVKIYLHSFLFFLEAWNADIFV